MYLYTESKEKINFNTSKKNKIGGHQQGNIFKISDDSCLKIYKSTDDVDLETLKLIKKLSLKNFYQLYNFYYTESGSLIGYTMRYYKNEEFDILSEDSSYTIDNLLSLLSSVHTLNQNNILISDMHTDNIIQNKEKITIIDTDLYRINRFFTQSSLEEHNINALKYLFESLYIDALKIYHPEYNSKSTIATIKNIFNLYKAQEVKNTINFLAQHKYPIDYIKRKVR